MNKEYAICRKCPIQRRCHTELLPTVMNAESNGASPVIKHEELNPWECLSFTCTGDGATAARHAAKNGPFAPHELVELDHSVTTEDAAPFASLTKPLFTRVVTRDARIYSQGQDGRYYRAHRIMNGWS
jgi:hypothetical protein